MAGLANLLGKARDVHDDLWVFRYANGLTVQTDPFMRPDRNRILPIGGPQDVLMNRLVHFPDIVRSKRVLDAFAGSGVLGLMALKLGAAQVDFVDINPRAAEFQIENCLLNNFARDRYRAIVSSVADVVVEQRYEIVLANPPFVPTPRGIEGTLTSRAGIDGNEFVVMLLNRLDAVLASDGQGYLVLLQMEANGTPLICLRLAELVSGRTFTFSPVQEVASDIDLYARAYRERFPNHEHAIRHWQGELASMYGPLQLQHYAVHISAKRPGPSTWCKVSDLASNYLENFIYPARDQYDLALGRVAENFIPS
jgi:hypothetical protein